MRKRLLSTLIALGLAWPAASWAADLTSVNQSIQRGDLAKAMQQVDGLIQANPKDPQYQFMRGVILIEQGRPDDAITTFKRLTQEYPELPEPYNNLAVLYAQKGEYEQARAALEMAIRTNPSYATAQENLGDIYAKLASQAYQKALQLDPGQNANTKLKLSLIRELFKQATPGSVLEQPKPTQSKPTVVAAAKPEVTAPPAKPQPAKPQPPKEAAPSKPTATVAPAPSKAPAEQPAPKPETAPPSPPPATNNASAAIDTAVQTWAAAWSNQNLPGYFAAYAPNFQPEKGLSLSAWKAQRRRLVGDKKDIHVEVKNLQVDVRGDKATARFKQIYKSGDLYFNGTKTLDMQEEGGKWLIVREIAR